MGEDDQVADPMLVGCVPGWTSDHRLRGITYIACNFDYDSGGGMFNGLPEITCTVQGKKLYDPTKDSTVTNGSGSHRQNDTSTHEHSDNSALVLLDYLTNPIYGKGIPYSAIDIQSFITAINKHTTTTNISHSATVESIDANADTVRLVKNSSNKAVFNKLKVGNQVTITNGSTTYATGTIISKTTNTRFDDQEKDYRDSNPNYVVDYDNLLIIHLSDGAVSTGLDFTETPVTITMTETGKRFPFNGVIDTEKSIFENVKDINANMRGIFTYTNGQYALKIEDSESVTLSIDDDDILSSGITVNLESKDSIYNIVEVEFANAQKDYELDTTSFKHTSATPGEDYTYDDNGEELKLTIDMSFITSQAIAYQYARAILLRSRNNKEIAFQGTPRLLNAKVGELISVTNTELGMNAEQYRITEMTINSDLTVQVNAIIYQSNIYGYVTPPGETIDIPDDPVDSFRVDTPTNLNFVDKDPSTGVQPYLTWNNSSNYPAYEFRVVIKDSSSNVLYDGRTKNTHFDLSGIQVANGYTAEVQAINTNRVESEVATYNFNNTVPPVQNDDLGDSSVTDSKVSDISAGKINTGELNLGTASGMAVRQGKTGYTSTTTGFWLGNDSGTPKFHIGTSSNFLKFDGSALNIAGSLTATNLTIDANATINGTLDASVIRLDGQDLSNLLAYGTVTGQTGNFFKINNQLDLEGRFYWDANNNTNYWDLGNGAEDQISLYVKAEAPIVFQDGGSALGTFELRFGDDINSDNYSDYISLVADWTNASQSSGDVTKFLIKGRSDDGNSAPQQTIASFEFSSADGFGLAKTVFNGHIETPRAVIEDYITIEQDTAPTSTTDKLYNVGGTLYWNGAVVDTGAGDITAVNITTSTQGGLTGGANFSTGDATFTLALAGSIPGSRTFEDDIVIEGDLTVQGATTSLEVATLNVEDKNITLNYGSGNTSGSANGSGITIQDAVSQGNDATILWNTSANAFKFSHDIRLDDAIRLEIGNSSDLRLYHNADSDSLIENTTNNLVLRNTADDKDIVLQTDNGSGGFVAYLRADGSTGETKLYNYGSLRLVTASDGIDIRGTTNGTFGLNIIDPSATSYGAHFSFDDTNSKVLIGGVTNGTKNTAISIPRDTTQVDFQSHITLPDSAVIKLGASSDLQIYHDGSDSYIKDNGTGDLLIQSNSVRLRATSGENMLRALENGAVELYYDNSKKLETSSLGIDVTGNIYLDNAGKILLAHNGSGTGYSSLYRASGNATRLEFRDNVLIFDSLDNSNINIYNSSGQNVHNFIIASNVTQGAIRTYGSYQVGTTTVLDNARNIININNVTISGNLKINSADIIHSNQTFGTFEWRANQQDSGKFSITVQGTSGAEFELYSDGSNYTNATLHIGGQRVLTQTAGINLNGDLGFNDGYKAKFGTNHDLQIYHDGSNSRIYNATGSLLLRNNDLYIQSTDGTTNSARFNSTTGVTLFRAGSPKLETTSTGIDVSGRLDVAQDIRLRGNSSTSDVGVASISIADANGSINFDAGNDGSNMTLTSTGDVGIGTASVSNPNGYGKILNVVGFAPALVLSETDTGKDFTIGVNGNELRIFDETTTRLSLDTSGNLLVGKTSSSTGVAGARFSANGFANVTRDGAECINFNRLTSDGTIIDLRKDSVTVGTIGTNSGYIRIGTGDTHLLYHSGIDTIIPYSGSANRDNAISLGYSGARFKDLHLSGNANIGGNLTVH